MRNCYCCSERKYTHCCEPYITGQCFPDTAEALMRSRYTAFCLQVKDYLNNTVKGDWDVHGALPQWRWRRLEVLETQLGGEFDTQGYVHFKAYYVEAGKEQCLEERSLFKRFDGRWFYCIPPI